MVGERAKFSKGKQREFLMKVIGKLMCRSLRDLLQFGIDVPYSTLKNYFIEEHLIPLSLLKDICHLSKIDINSLNIIILPENWGAIKGGKRGIISMMKIYEDKLPLWRARGNKKIAEINTKKINFPKLNEELAEFIGIYLGDGTLTKYFLRISGDYRYDIPYFNYIYDVHLNISKNMDNSILGPYKKLSATLSARRIDVTIQEAGITWIVEIRPDAKHNAIGQLVLYRYLYILQFNPKNKIRLMIVTDRFNAEIQLVCNAVGIVYKVL